MASAGLLTHGIRPTVTRIRAALGGGSPNDLAPALKNWKETYQSTVSLGDHTANARLPIPVQIADLAHELWQRATVAAAVELKGGSAARLVAMRTADTESLRQQITSLRDQMQRETMASGELRAQAARHEAIARDALARLDASETRERKHLGELGSARERLAELDATVTQLRDLGSARERVTELDATVNQLRTRPASSTVSRRRPAPSTRKARSSKPTKRRRKKASGARAARSVREPRAHRQSRRPRAINAKSTPPIRVIIRAKKTRRKARAKLRQLR